jgi:hypothetical protein
MVVTLLYNHPQGETTMKDTIKCELCGLECSMQISASHLRAKHNLTTKEYKALGHLTLSPARLEQLRQSPVGSGELSGERGKYGPDHWNWKGGHVSGSGYRITYKNGRRDYEHRLVAEEMLGRLLADDEVVHHRDGNRQNNTPDNLVVMKRAEHDKIKDRTREWFYTNADVEAAAVALKGIGWSQTRISRALRVHHGTVKRWLSS